jgi:hypothetical protein
VKDVRIFKVEFSDREMTGAIENGAKAHIITKGEMTGT